MSQRQAHLFGDRKQDWCTPDWLFAELSHLFGPFDLDAAASDENARCRRYFTKATDGLSQEWAGRVFVNPPYDDIGPWVAKAAGEAACGRASVVMLLPVRTSAGWFHEHVWMKAPVLFLRKRLRFNGGHGATAPFDCMVVLFGLAIKASAG